MEAVPRLPMISFHLKVSPEPTSFAPKLKQYIREFYNEDPESYANEIHQLEGLRAMAVRPPIDVAGCSLLKKYYCQLHFLQSRFPMGKDGVAAVTFTWRDTYANMVCSLANIRFEIISVLYNIGAVHTQLGARTERTTADGMKMACAHFQCAAWAFEHLKNSYPQPPGVDLAPELMTFMHQLCLAQAQECILEKSMLDNRKATIVAKVAMQIVEYYSLALNTLEQGGNDDGSVSDTVGSKIYKSWKRYVKFKRAYHLAVAQLYHGQSAEEQQKMGERVAFYNASLATLNEASNLYGNALRITSSVEEREAIEEALTFTNDVIEGKRKAAKNENEFIYHEEVPERDALPPIKGASLVKGIPFSINDPEVAGPDIFARLVPMKVHEASSLYSEEKAKILRTVGGKIEERDQQLVTYLASLRLDNMSLWDPDSRESDSNRLALPEELAERCAALNAKPNAIQDLVDAMGKLADTYHDVEAMLRDIDQLLNQEQVREKRYQEVMGKRPPSIVATDLTREANKYEEAHAKASESNQALHRAMTLHVSNLRILAQPLADLIAHIPSFNDRSSGQNERREPQTDQGGTSSATASASTRELKRILGKVDEMRRQRGDLHAQLRDAIAQDDLTRLLVTATTDSGSLDRLFAEQINKHHKLVGLIDQNLAAQDNVLAALTDAYARTADSRKATDEILKRRDATVSSLISSYDAYEDLLAKSSKGLEFYRKLETNVTKLLQRVKSTCKVQEEEREQILARNNKAVSKTSDSEETPTSSGVSGVAGGSGYKLKDYLASRQNPYYNPLTSQSGPPQPLPVQPAPSEQEGNDAIGANSVALATSDSPDPKQNYQYHPGGYAGYYTGQTANYNMNYTYAQYPEYLSSINQSLPMSVTTNTASTYHQASGSRDTTEVTSYGGQYVGYNTQQGGQTGCPPDQSGQSQYPTATQAQYNPAGAYGRYPGYPTATPEQASGYASPSSVSSQQNQHPATADGNFGYSTGYSASPQNMNSGVTAQNQQNFGENKAKFIENQQNLSETESASRHNRQPSPQVQPIHSNQPNLPMDQSQHGVVQNRQSASHGTQPQHGIQQITGLTQQMSISNLQHPSQTQQIAAQNQQVPPQVQQMIPQNHQVPSAAQQVAPQTQLPIVPQSHNPSQAQQVVPHNQQIPPQSQQNSTQNPSSSVPYSTVPQYPHSRYNNSPSLQYTAYPGGTVAAADASSVPYGTTSYPPGVHQNQQGYSNSTNSQQQQIQSQMRENYTSVVAQSGDPVDGVGGGGRGRNTQVTMSYPDGQQSFGNYQQNLGGTLYQIQTTQGPSTGQNYAHGTYADHSEMIQSHAKLTAVQNYPHNYQYAVNGQYPNSMSMQNYHAEGYDNNYSQVSNNAVVISQTDSYKGHPGYSYDPTNGGYQYSSGYQNSRNPRPITNEADAMASPQQSNSAHGNYVRPEGNAQYTNASNNVATNQTLSSQYSQQSYPPPAASQTYYTSPYGHQVMEGTIGPGNDSGPSQTYMQAANNGTNTTTSPSVEKTLAVKPAEPKSNVDLLADLEFSINHAPLVPQVNTVMKTEVEDVKEKEDTIRTEPRSDETSVMREIKTEVTSSASSIEINENLQIVWDTWYTDVQPKKDPLGDPQVLQKFAFDVEKYEKFMDGLLAKTLSGATTLDIKWKEVRDFLEREAQKQSQEVALSHPSDNRVATSVPYDATRVELEASEGQSPYINASHVKDVTQWTPAAFIVTQAPTSQTSATFWTMIWEQGSEVIACLTSDHQLNNETYWPTTSGQELTIGNFVLSLENSVNHATYIERIINVTRSEIKTPRTVVHMQFTAWPSTGFPSSPGSFLAFATDVLSEQALRRCSPRPVVVQCLDGGIISGLFLVAAAAVCHVRAGRGLVDATIVFSTLVRFRRSLVDKEALLFAYRMILYNAQDVLMKRGVLSSSRSTFECFEGLKTGGGSNTGVNAGRSGRSRGKTQQRHPSDDFLHNRGVLRSQHDFNAGQAAATGESAPASASMDPREKLDEVKPVDPLSQLDPMWSIRK